MMVISDLPHDLKQRRVPARSLWELRATCKRWYALFLNPRFIEKNTKWGEAVRETMLVSNFRVYSIAGNLHGLPNNGIEPSIMVTGKLRSLKSSKDLGFSEMYHCDGLMLCITKGNTRLVVWSPCIGQTRLIEPRTCYRSSDTYALGYSTSSFSSGHSYKILRRCNYENDQKVWIVECEIYELSSDYWRVLDSFPLDYILSCDGISLKGNNYWVAKNEETGFFLVKFGFTTERFVRLPLPFQSFADENTVALLAVKNEKLSVLHQNIYPFSNVMKI